MKITHQEVRKALTKMNRNTQVFTKYKNEVALIRKYIAKYQRKEKSLKEELK